MLQFYNVGKRFGSHWAPVRYSLAVKPGEIVWLSGPPGAGKSVLVRIALGVSLPSSGSVEVNGLNPARQSGGERRLMRRRISAVLDDEPPLGVDVESWVALGLWCQGRPWGKSLAAAREAMEEFGIVHLVRRRFDEIARGERFSAALARAIVRKPELLLVDWAGAFADPPPEGLAGGFSRYVSDGGACLAVGEPGTGFHGPDGRRERIEIEKTA